VLDRIRTAMQGMLVALRTIALELRTTSIESADRAREISAGCGTAAGTAQRISATTSDLARQLTGMAGTLREIASVGTRLRESSATISADVHEGNERNARLRQLASENRVRLEESGQALTELVAGTETSALEIEALAAASEEIRAFVTLVRKMARQSKLLALNAAMEAARAGEHGQGFAVVASEVRRLARSSAEAAEKTDALVTDVLERVARARAASSHAVVTVRGALAATEHGLGSFLEVERGVIESEAWAAAIDASAAEASTVVAEMSSRLEEVARGGETVAIAMRDVARASESQNAGSRDIAAASLALADSAARVATVVATFRLDPATKLAPSAAAERATPSPLASIRSPHPAAT
jgi:methyl-accepting chemotaxis protein